MPLQRRLPKRGFNNLFKTVYQLINIKDLERFESGAVVDIKALKDAGLVKGRHVMVKVLGQGDISHPIEIKVHRASRSAREKIEGAGGKVEFI
jgi:large subunit ribosomal protein L15